MGTDLDFDDFGVFRLVHLGGRLATLRARRLVRRQFDLFFDRRQVRVIASPRSGRVRLLAARPSWFLGGFRIVEAVGSILRRLLFRLGREEPVLELPILGAKRVDFLLEFFVLPLRLLEHPLPIPDLLPQFGNLAT